MCQYLADILRQKAQELIFYRRQMHLLAAYVSTTGGIIDLKLTIHKNCSRGLISARIQSSLAYPDPRKQLFYRKRLCKIIIGARIKSVDLVLVLTSCADNNYRHFRPASDFTDDLHTVNIVKTEIKQEYIGIMC